VCVRISDVTRKYNVIFSIVTIVNKQLCVVVNTVITLKCQSLNVWKYGRSLNFAQLLVKHRQIPTKNLKGQAGPVQCHEGWFFKCHKRFVEGRELVDMTTGPADVRP
jgi:hypothetical protein